MYLQQSDNPLGKLSGRAAESWWLEWTGTEDLALGLWSALVKSTRARCSVV